MLWRLIARPLDRCAIRSARGCVLPSPDGHAHAEEALDLLRRPDFFSPAIEPARIELTRAGAFSFPSAVRTVSEENNVVRGHFEPAGKNWQEKPSVILLHGWNAELQYRWQLPFWSQLLARAGVNALRFELPYHSSRRPKPPAIRNFLSGNLLHVMQATHQALADVRALAEWLRAQGSPAIGLWGVSLGGWLAGLAAARQPGIDLAVLLTPVVRMDRALRELSFCDSIRDHIKVDHEDFRLLNLVAHAPALASENMLVVAAQLDLFAPTDTIDELEHAWRPEMWRLPHGHISIVMSRRPMGHIVKWIAAKAHRPRFDTVQPAA